MVLPRRRSSDLLPSFRAFGVKCSSIFQLSWHHNWSYLSKANDTYVHQRAFCELDHNTDICLGLFNPAWHMHNGGK